MRKPIIAGNWKMHKTVQQAVDFIDAVKKEINGTDVEALICAPYTLLPAMVERAKGTALKIGAENMHFEDQGAFTGEISADMLMDIGVEYVILGHSERRQYFAETDETVNKKLKKAIKMGIKPIVCCGETLTQRESGETTSWVEGQITKAFEGIEAKDAQHVVVAYEPIWAIGTGKTASAEDAGEVIAFIRTVFERLYGSEYSEEIRIQYGGSVKPSNVEELMNQYDIDGALVGGASLQAEDFVKLVNF